MTLRIAISEYGLLVFAVIAVVAIGVVVAFN
jgi:hypothetical protein